MLVVKGRFVCLSVCMYVGAFVHSSPVLRAIKLKLSESNQSTLADVVTVPEFLILDWFPWKLHSNHLSNVVICEPIFTKLGTNDTG